MLVGLCLLKFIEQDLKQNNHQNIEEDDEIGWDLVIDEGEEDIPTFPLENIKYTFVYIKIETMVASNSKGKEITQIGGFKENPLDPKDKLFFKAI